MPHLLTPNTHICMSLPSNNSILLSADQLAYAINGKAVLDGVSMEVHESEILTLIGPNGAGKSTLIKCLLGIYPASKGSVYRKNNLSIGYVPQKTRLNSSIPMDVGAFLKLAGSFSQSEILEALSLVGAENAFSKPVDMISGGEFQRVMLARALLRKPQLLVLDEPSQGVDIRGQQNLYSLLGEIRENYKTAILMVSHDLHLVMSNTDKVICLNQHICCSGHPESVSTDPAYLQLFGIKEGEGIAVYEHHHDHQHDVSGEVVSKRQHDD